LKRSFFSFLTSQNHREIRPYDFNEELFAGYYRFISGRRISGQPLHPSSVRQMLGSLRAVLSALDTGKWAPAAKTIRGFIPSGPVGAAKKSVPVDVLSLEHLRAIIAAAERELNAFEEHRIEGFRLLEKGRIELSRGSRDYRGSLALCLAAVEATYPGVIPDCTEIRKLNRKLGGAISGVHGAVEVARYFYPISRDLVSFVVLLSVVTVFNPDTVLSLKWENIDEDVDRLGTPSIRIAGEKLRSNNDPVRMVESGDRELGLITIKGLLKILRESTSRLRPYVIFPEHRDNLFLFIQMNASKHPRSFGNPQSYGPSADESWRKALAHFCRANNLEKFTLGQIRPTLIDMTSALNGDLGAGQALAPHEHASTTWTYYTSSAVKKRFTERIGEALLLRDRWIQTKGIINPRMLTQKQDQSAATPGFICHDPFDSPRPNQTSGRLCSAYGECPSCPLVAANPNDPVSVALYFALRKSIFRSQLNMGTQSWLQRWAPILADLNALLNLIPEEVVTSSNAYQVSLPPVG
jgi:hypothetical protein